MLFDVVLIGVRDVVKKGIVVVRFSWVGSGVVIYEELDDKDMFVIFDLLNL